LAETVVYRLAVSPGTRALRGLRARRGRVVRPLLELSRDETRAMATEAGLPLRDDPSNLDPAYSRNRVRHRVLPVLEELNPGYEAAIAETAAELAEEAELLDRLAQEAIAAGLPLAEMEPGLRRLVLRAQAEAVAGKPVALGRARAEAIWELAQQPQAAQVEIGDGLVAVCESGAVHFRLGEPPEPLPAKLGVPGSCRFGGWEVRAEVRPAPMDPAGPDLATLDAGALGDDLEVRSWRDGDHMRPLGLGGTKSVQDLFTDAKVPRSLRRTLPVVIAGGEIAWVAGVAVSEEFKLTGESRDVAVLTARTVE
jgi:tRNA(Ile)-lysidine synthase